MGRGDLSDKEWARLRPHLPKNVGRGGRWKSHRQVINGILFRQRTGVPWRDLPVRFGKWKTVHDRHRRWSADGTWERILRAGGGGRGAGGGGRGRARNAARGSQTPPASAHSRTHPT
ncbi:transposase, partial [Streptomyces anulatus]|uniref:transposase n=1 Tax=Streptomyces anulatus TaxID=1892 RepID=UPI00364ECCFB